MRLQLVSDGQMRSEQRARSRSASPAASAVPSRIDLLDLKQVCARANGLNQAHKPQDALAVLLPHAQRADARQDYVFQARLGESYMDVAHGLELANQLGVSQLILGPSGDWHQGRLESELLSCYVGILGAYGQLLHLLQQPGPQGQFVTKHGGDMLSAVRQNLG